VSPGANTAASMLVQDEALEVLLPPEEARRREGRLGQESVTGNVSVPA